MEIGRLGAAARAQQPEFDWRTRLAWRRCQISAQHAARTISKK